MADLEHLVGPLGSGAPNGIVIVDDTGDIAWVNAALEGMFGYEKGALLGQPLEVLVPMRRRAHHKILTSEFRKAPATRSMGGTEELRGQRADGHEIVVEVGLSSIEFDGQLYSVAFVVDISERFRRAKELEMHRRNLESLIDERTEDLRLALRTTEANANLLSQVMSSIGHELRTPLGALIGYAELLSTFAWDESPQSRVRQKQYVQFILKSGLALSNLVQKASNMTMISTGVLAADRSPIDLAKVIDSARDRTVAGLGLDDLKVEVDPSASIRVLGDKELTERVLGNLFENSAKYAGPDCIVRISAIPGETMTRILVEDDGEGIQGADAVRVFDAFERLEQKHGAISGAGLGLTLARAYVQAMGGRIGARQSVEKGTQIWIELPLA